LLDLANRAPLLLLFSLLLFALFVLNTLVAFELETLPALLLLDVFEDLLKIGERGVGCGVGRRVGFFVGTGNSPTRVGLGVVGEPVGSSVGFSVGEIVGLSEGE